MRVALLHNSSAGSEDHTDAELTRLIQKAGHEVVHAVGRVGDLKAALHERPCDLVVVAGGDGTVGRAACELSGWQVPIAILPLGTANNTARSLGVPARVKTAVKSWSGAGQVPFDLGVLDDGVERVRFAECVGWGVFARTIVEARRRDEARSVTQTLKRDRKLFRSILTAIEPRSYRVQVDGRDVSGDYVLVEILNIPLLGPQLMLSGSSQPSDGELEVVLVADAERAALDQVAKTGKASSGYRIERGRRIRVETDDALLHRDGKLVRHARGTRSFEIRVDVAGVHYLR
jgi:diacylglycerol kinase family enzyme